MMKTLVGIVNSTYDLKRAFLSLQRAGFGSVDLQFSYLTSQKQPWEPGTLQAWLHRGGFLGDTMDRSDGSSLMDGTTAGATIFSLLGVVYGSVLPMGPITGGVLGILGGGIVGWLLDQAIGARLSRGKKVERASPDSCLVLVRCDDDERLKAAKNALKEAQVVMQGIIE